MSNLKNLVELIQLSQDGSEKSKLLMVNKYEPLFISICNSFYIKGLGKEDLYQIAITEFLLALENYDTERNTIFGAYVRTCITNRFITEMKKAEKYYLNLSLEEVKEGVILKQMTPECGQGIEEEYIKKEEKEILIEAITNLSKEQRTLIKKKYVEGESINSYSKLAGISYYKAVKSEENILKNLEKKLQ